MNCNLQKNIAEIFHQNAALSSLVEDIERANQPFWLVGGCLRDLLLDRVITDIDICSTEDPTQLARTWAAKVHGRWFWLDADRFQSRVLLNSKIHVDFSPLRAETIIEDLELRDFTINSFALLIDSELSHGELLDPLKGQVDLQKKLLRVCSSQSFTDDPLRMLKGIRHAVTLGFDCAASTLTLMSKFSSLLSSVAGERIKDEFLKILSSECPVQGLELLVETGLLKELFGSPGDNWNHSRAFEQLNDLQMKLAQINRTIEISMSEDSRPDSLSNTTLFLLVNLLQQYSPDKLPELLHKTLRFSRSEQHLVEQLISKGAEVEETFSLQEVAQSKRAKALAVELLEPYSLEKMLYWGVCQNKFTYQQALYRHQAFVAEQKIGRVPDLLNGQEVAEIINLPYGPHIGLWQHRLKNAEIKGDFATKQGASKWLKKQITV
jgi:poly(A) polymerase